MHKDLQLSMAEPESVQFDRAIQAFLERMG